MLVCLCPTDRATSKPLIQSVLSQPVVFKDAVALLPFFNMHCFWWQHQDLKNRFIQYIIVTYIHAEQYSMCITNLCINPYWVWPKNIYVYNTFIFEVEIMLHILCKSWQWLPSKIKQLCNRSAWKPLGSIRHVRRHPRSGIWSHSCWQELSLG